MNDRQRFGGIAALIGAGTTVLGAAVYTTVLQPKGLGAAHPDPDKVVSLIVGNETAMYLWYATIYLVFGACVLVLTRVLYERMASRAETDAHAVAVVGIVYGVWVLVIGALSIRDVNTVVRLYSESPARSASVWSTLDAVETGLGGGGGETMLSGLWLLLVSWVATRTGALPRPVDVIGAVVGVSGILAVVTAATALTAIYAVGLIAWLLWLGIVMLRDRASSPPIERATSLRR